MRLLLPLLLSSSIYVGKTTGTDCPNFWTSFQRSCYALFPHQEPWTQANYICEEHGGRLAFIESAAENAFITTLIKNSKVGKESVWIGANDMMREGSFTWGATDEPLTYSNWYPGEPNKGGGVIDEDCVEIDVDEGYKWNDDRCSNPLNFICERSSTEEVVG